MKPGFLLLLYNQINSVFEGLSFSRLEDIHQRTESEHIVKRCNATRVHPQEKDGSKPEDHLHMHVQTDQRCTPS